MPDRSYIARNGEPPSLWDHYLAHPGETAVAVGWVVIGVIMLAQVGIDGFEPSSTLAALSVGLGSGVAVAITIGGTLAILGLLWKGKPVGAVWRELNDAGEIDRRVAVEVLPDQVRYIATQWAELFPDDPQGWKYISLEEEEEEEE